MPEALTTKICPKCKKPFEAGQATLEDIVNDSHGNPTMVERVHARCSEQSGSLFTGKQGPEGATGPSGGRTGAKGEDGSTGNTGGQGLRGLTGQTGPPPTVGAVRSVVLQVFETMRQSLKGDTGDTGGQGEGGTPGADGDAPTAEELLALIQEQIVLNAELLKGGPGDPGKQGATGVGKIGGKGDTGDPGAPGESIKGDIGGTGAAGADGNDAEPSSDALILRLIEQTLVAYTEKLKGEQGERGSQGYTGGIGPRGADAKAEVGALLERLKRTEKVVAKLAISTQVAGVVFCPSCAKGYDIKDDLKIEGSFTRIRFICDEKTGGCGADLLLTPEGVEVRRG